MIRPFVRAFLAEFLPRLFWNVAAVVAVLCLYPFLFPPEVVV